MTTKPSRNLAQKTESAGNHIARLVVVLLLTVMSLADGFSANRFPVPFETLKTELLTCMTNDRFGRSWIGTTKGIFVYDGTTLNKYRRTGSNRSTVLSLISSFTFLDNGKLVATCTNGAFVYEEASDEFREVSSHIANTRVMTAFPNGQYLLNDYKRGRLLLADSTLTHIRKSLPISLRDIWPAACYHLKNGNCLIAKSDVCIIVTPQLKLVAMVKTNAKIHFCHESLGRIMLATDHGIVSVSQNGKTVSNPAKIEALTKGKKVRFVTGRGTDLYFGITGEGIISYNTRTGRTRVISNSVNGTPIGEGTYMLHIDASRQLWFMDTTGNYLGCDIVRTNPNLSGLEVILDMANYPNLRELTAYTFDLSGQLYILTSSGIFKFDQQASDLSFVLPIPSSTCRDIVFDKAGHLFVVSDYIIYVYDVSGGTPRLLKQVPTSYYYLILHAVTDNFTVFSCKDKLVSFDNALNVYTVPIPPIEDFAYIYPSRDNKSISLRVGFAYSAKYSIGRGFYEEKYHKEPYGTDYSVWTSGGRCWSATKFSGVIIGQNGVSDTLSVEQGLPDNSVYAVQEDRWGNIWASTTNGLVKIYPNDKHIVDYEDANGMLFDLSYGHLQKSPAGDVYVSSSRYLLKVNNLSEKESMVAAPTVFDITANNSVFNGYPEEVAYSHNQNNLVINFATVDMARGPLLKYEYWLESYEQDWHQSDAGTAVYNNLPPGNYVLHVRAHLRGGKYSEETTVGIHIRPAFWQTWWFKLIILLLAIALSAASVRYYIRTRLSLAEYKLRVEKEHMKLDLYTNLSHIIRTPVSLVSAPFHQLVDGRQWTEKEQRLIDVINKSIERIMNLTQQFLESWSGDDETSDPMDKTVRLEQKDIVTIVRDTALMFRPTAVEKGITLQLNTPEQLVVQVDEDKMVKILYNLMSNAMKHTPGGGMITISVSCADRQLSLSVADTGKGIADDKKQKIFDKFFMGAHIAGRGESFGIGLHHTRQLVSLLGGKITVRDNKPHGAVFEVAVSVAESEKSVVEPQTRHTFAANDVVIAENSRPHLLIVEDNDDMRAYLADSLSEKYDVSTAVDGMEATGVFEKDNIDIVVTDVMMPRMDGYALCRWIKENPDFCHIPVCILTAKSAKSDELEGVGVGADAYQKKPFELPFLLAIIDNLLSNRRKVQQAIMSRIGSAPAVTADEGGKDVSAKPEAMLNVRDRKFMEQLRQLMEDHLDDDQYGVPELWRDMGFSKTNFYKKVKALTGTTPNQVMQDFHFAKVLELLDEGKHTIGEVSYMTGFTSVSSFSRKFRAVYGMSPTEYLKAKGNS